MQISILSFSPFRNQSLRFVYFSHSFLLCKNYIHLAILDFFLNSKKHIFSHNLVGYKSVRKSLRLQDALLFLFSSFFDKNFQLPLLLFFRLSIDFLLYMQFRFICEQFLSHTSFSLQLFDIPFTFHISVGISILFGCIWIRPRWLLIATWDQTISMSRTVVFYIQYLHLLMNQSTTKNFSVPSNRAIICFSEMNRKKFLPT